MELGSPRWKGGGHAISKSNPMSVIVSQLQEILLQSKAQAFASGADVFLEATANQRHLLTCASFGVLEANAQQQLFQLDFEEAFYLFDEMKCISIAGEDGKVMGGGDIWEYMVSRKRMFPWHYQAYSHLRRKNWVVRSGSMYGVDFVIYRHHPALVHSEFAAIVMAQNNGENDARLRVWSDWEGMIRVCGSVAKTLLVVYISNVKNETWFPSCLENCTVSLRTFSRWDPERCREDCSAKKQETFWESVVSEFKAAEPPTGFQGLLSWLFIPTIIGALVYHVPGEYMYIGAAIFVVIFCGIEMGKPDEPLNFEPQIYNMERAARDKLIADYNTMDIWDFNEKYGELWDFTVKNDDLVK